MSRVFRRTPRPACARPYGFALVLVLWIMSVLMIMAGSFVLSMRRESVVVAAIKNNAEAAALAESGLVFAELMLLHPDPNKRWRANGSIYPIVDANLLGRDDAEVRVRLLSETGKIDINKADEKLLTELFAHAPVADDDQRARLVGALLDWRDNDDLLNLNGAEKEQYQAAGLSYQPRNKPFQTVDELQLLLGMEPALYQWLASLVTVYSGKSNVDLSLASKDVLQVLPDVDLEYLDGYLADRLESTRSGLPEPMPPLTTMQTGNLSSPAKHAGAAARAEAGAITAVAEAQLEDGSSTAISVVIKTGGDTTIGQPFQVLEWQRNMPGVGSLFAETVGVSDISELLVEQYAESKFKH